MERNPYIGHLYAQKKTGGKEGRLALRVYKVPNPQYPGTSSKERVGSICIRRDEFVKDGGAVFDRMFGVCVDQPEE